MQLFFRVLDFCWTWLYAAVRLPFVLIGWLLAAIDFLFVTAVCFIAWLLWLPVRFTKATLDAVWFILGWPTFYELEMLRLCNASLDGQLTEQAREEVQLRQKLGDMTYLRDRHRETNRELLKENSHLKFLNKALAKNGNSQAGKIRALESELSAERDAHTAIKARLNEILNYS